VGKGRRSEKTAEWREPAGCLLEGERDPEIARCGRGNCKMKNLL
jgi:hypothetical protein